MTIILITLEGFIIRTVVIQRVVLFECEVFESHQLFQLSTNLHSITLNCVETEDTLLDCNKVKVYFL